MSEKEKESVKYKFGESEIDLKNYIRALDYNVQSYMDSKKWNEGQRNEFMNSYRQYLQGFKEQLDSNNSRFSTDSFGVISDSTGTYNDNNPGTYYNDKGESIDLESYNALKDKLKRKYKNFHSGRELATFFNTVGKALRDKESSKKTKSTKEKFDVTKHGFVADWLKRNGASGEKIDLAPYINMDAYDETTKKRGREKRTAYLQNQIQNFINSFDGDFDFEGTPYDSLEDYKAKLKVLSDKLSDGWSDDDIIAANQAGIGKSFYHDFFTEEKDPSITQAQKTADEKAKKEKEVQDAWKAETDRRYAIWQRSQGYKKNNPFSITVGNDYTDESGKFNISKWRESFKIDDPYYKLISTGEGKDLLDYLNEVLKNPYTSEFNRAMLYMINNNLVTQLGDGRYYIRQESDKDTLSGLVYDPQRRALYKTFLGDILSEWDLIKKLFFIDKNPEGGASMYYKNGGSLLKLQIGGYVDAVGDYERSIKNDISSKAKLQGKTDKEYEADNRKIGTGFTDAEVNANNPDTEFTHVEYARIGGAIADIASIVTAFVPGAGTVASGVAGFTSTLANGWADLFDDGVSGWLAFKNFGISLGMDIAGMIPGGGAASKCTKVVRSIGKLIPKVSLALGALGAFKNREGIMESLKKVVDSPADLSVQDWLNVAQALSLVAGASNVASAAYGKKARADKASRKANTSDKIALDVKTSDGTTKTILFEGTDAAKIRTARDANDVDAVNNILKNYEGTKDMTIATDLDLGFKKGNKWYKPVTIGDTGSGKMGIYDIVTDPSGQYIIRGDWTADTRLNSASPLDTYGHSSQTVSHFDDLQQQRRTDIIEDLRIGSDKMKATRDKAQRQLDTRQLQIDDLNSQLSGLRREADINADISRLRALHVDPGYINRQTDFAIKEAEYRNIITTQNNMEALLLDHILHGTALPSGKTRAEFLADLDTIRSIATSKKADLDAEEAYFKANDTAALSNLNDELANVTTLQQQLRNITTANANRYNKARQWIDDVNAGRKRSKAYNDFVSTHTNADGNISWDNPGGRDNTTMTVDEFNDMLRRAGVLYRKGGSFEHVRKFKEAGKITNTTSTVNWFDDMFQSKEMTDWLYTFNKDNFEQFNNLQKSWAINKRNTGYIPGSTKISSTKDKGVWDRQAEWNKTGTNAVIKRATDKERIKSSGTTGDNESGNYQDGFFGEQEFLRHGGTKESWEGREKELKIFQDALKSRGLNYTLDNESGMYLLSAIELPETPVTTATPGTTRPVTPEVTTPQNTSSKKSYLENIKGWLDDPTVKYGLPRALYADAMNRKITDLAISSEQPLLQNPFEVHRTVQSNLNSEIQGLQSAAQLMNMASKPLTSDGSLQTATQLEAANKAQQFINLGKDVSDQAYRASSEAAFAQEKENAKNRHSVATQNLLTMLLSAQNKSKYEQAYLTKKHEVWDTLAKQFEYDARTKKAKVDSYTDAYVLSDISNYVTANLATLDPSLDPKAVELYALVRNGVIEASELSKDPEKWKLFKSAAQSASKLETELLRKHYGVRPSRWTTSLTTSNTDPVYQTVIPEDKKGGKLEIAGIKARTKDAEMFQKYINEAIKRNEKALNRLSKSVYSYVKASIV